MPKNRSSKESTQSSMPFGALNYKVLALGLLLVIVGFSAMYIDNQVRGVVSLFISPIVIMAGYGTVIYSIMARSKATEQKAG